LQRTSLRAACTQRLISLKQGKSTALILRSRVLPSDSAKPCSNLFGAPNSFANPWVLRFIECMSAKEPIILLEKVSKRYGSSNSKSTTNVLTEVDLEVYEGESMAIIGPSGSGKSTLLNIMGALDTASDGFVCIAGRHLNEAGENELAEFRRRTVGFIFQAHHLLPQLSVMENVLVPLLAEPQPKGMQEAEERGRVLLKRVGLDHRLDHKPGQLSGGEKQRAAVVRALICKPRILLADEPTGALDRKSSENLAQLLMELNHEEGLTLMTVTHSMELARLTGTVLELEDGHLQTNRAS